MYYIWFGANDEKKNMSKALSTDETKITAHPKLKRNETPDFEAPTPSPHPEPIFLASERFSY